MIFEIFTVGTVINQWKKMSNDALWETYKRQVGWVVRNAPDFK